LAEVWPGRRLFYLMNEPVAAEVEQVWGRSASRGLATGDPSGIAAEPRIVRLMPVMSV